MQDHCPEEQLTHFNTQLFCCPCFFFTGGTGSDGLACLPRVVRRLQVRFLSVWLFSGYSNFLPRSKGIRGG